MFLKGWWPSCPIAQTCCLSLTGSLLSIPTGPALPGVAPPCAGAPAPGPRDGGAIAAAPAQTPPDKAKGLDSFLLFNLNPIRWNIVPFFFIMSLGEEE